MSAPKPYTDSEVRELARKLHRSQFLDDGFASMIWKGVAESERENWFALATVALDALAEAGRLLPDGATPYADGYAAAVAALRNDQLYHNWWTALPGDDPDYGYWRAAPRREMAAYLETIGPDSDG